MIEISPFLGNITAQKFKGQLISLFIFAVILSVLLDSIVGQVHIDVVKRIFLEGVGAGGSSDIAFPKKIDLKLVSE